MSITVTTEDPSSLAASLINRFGDLALARAAGEANSANRSGDNARSALWYGVIAHLRRTMTTT